VVGDSNFPPIFYCVSPPVDIDHRHKPIAWNAEGSVRKVRWTSIFVELFHVLYLDGA